MKKLTDFERGYMYGWLMASIAMAFLLSILLTVGVIVG
jgi:hypothetical protein